MGFDSSFRPSAPPPRPPARGTRAFTLVELLVVIGVIAILAGVIVAFIIPKAQQAALHTATAEMRQIETAIDSYHADFGTYPPDNQSALTSVSTTYNTNSVYLPPLFYELSGAVANQANGVATGTYGTNQTFIAQADYTRYFGLAGPQNSSPANLRSYLRELRPAQVKALPGTTVYVLTCSVGTSPAATAPYLNPWNYNSSNPTNNPAGYDLYNNNILIGNKYYTIGNWNR